MTHEMNLAGYYGKLPLRGDFIQRNLDSDFITSWDNWLQSVIARSRETLGEQWLNYYLVSPIWRFYLPTDNGIVYCGVMLPSVDKVGRYFPFTLASIVDQKSTAEQYILNNQQWFNQAEDLALQALDESISLEQLNFSLDSLNQQLMVRDTLEQLPPVRNFRIPLKDSNNLSDAFSQLNRVLPTSTSQPYSYWWTAGNEQIAGNLLCSDKMPDDNMYTAMLDGQWELCHVHTFDENISNNQNIYS